MYLFAFYPKTKLLDDLTFRTNYKTNKGYTLSSLINNNTAISDVVFSPFVVRQPTLKV